MVDISRKSPATKEIDSASKLKKHSIDHLLNYIAAGWMKDVCTRNESIKRMKQQDRNSKENIEANQNPITPIQIQNNSVDSNDEKE